MNDEKRGLAVKLLCDKQQEIGRTPKKSDFDSDTVCFIKQKLGPFPRALEVAGLKEVTKLTGAQKSKIKRERAKANRKA